MDILKLGIIGGVLGLLVGLNIFKIVDWTIRYKMEKANKEVPYYETTDWTKIVIVPANIILYVLAFTLMPPFIAVLTSIFSTIGLVGILIDMHIRIIPNEMVLLIAGLGVIYRIADGGFISLLSSLKGLLLITFLFAAAAGVTFFLKGNIGVGAGDIKLAMAIGITLGFPEITFFLIGFAGALVVFTLMGFGRRVLVWNSYFPMAAHIMIGFGVGLYFPYLNIFL